MGLLFLLLLVEARGWDVIPDPVGWALIAYGVRRLPPQVGGQGALLYLAAVAGLVSLALWPALPGDPLGDVDPSLQWAMNLPQLLFCTLLAWRLAGASPESTARSLLRVDAGMFAAAAVLPPIVFGGGVRALEEPSYLIAGLALMTFIVLMFVYSGRDWARADEPAA